MVGALVAMSFDLSLRVVGTVVAFGAGVLISAVAFAVSIWLVIRMFADVFTAPDLSGWAKATASTGPKRSSPVSSDRSSAGC